ncbi:hypothetical protein [Fontivita pretiosa]|uniref:hypothetical protein n=1 Tax=Fontivita pretiosa TaxID=2989684 RepID=UPI003D17CC16
MSLIRSAGGGRVRAVITGVAVIASVAIAGVLWARQRARNRALADAGNDPIKIIHAAEQGKISQADRDAAISRAVHSQLSERLEAYFALPAGKPRQDYLDKLIDEQEQARQKLQHLQMNQGSGTIDLKDSPGVNVKVQTSPLPNGAGQAKRVTIRKGGDGSELPPELRAKAAEFAAAIARRRAERGLPAGPDGKMGIVIVKSVLEAPPPPSQ